MKKSKQVLFQSVIALVLCFSMLVGTTFAWFTDGTFSGSNLIAAGNLDVELEYLDENGQWQKVTEQTEVLDQTALWEPGHTEVAYLRVSNVGDLALKYALGIHIVSEIGSINAAGEAFKLSDHIRFGVLESETEATYADRTAARNALAETKIISAGYTSQYSLYAEAGRDVRYVTLVVYMPEDVGNVANHATGVNPPEIQLGIELVATQEAYESDSFGSDYDANAAMPEFTFPENVFGENASAGVSKDSENKVTEGVTIQGTTANAIIPAGVQMEANADKLTLEVTSMTGSQANITLGENDAVRSLNVHVEGVSGDNTQPMEITIKEAAAVGLNAGNIKLYHVENGTTVEMTAVDTFTAHNQFKYDPATGDITLYMATFSEVAVVADTENAWNGTVATAFAGGAGTDTDPYLIANADQFVYFGDLISNDNDSYGVKCYKLVANINLGGESNANGGKIFYPVGYHKVGGSIATIDLDDAPEAIYEINEDSRQPGSAVAAGGASNWYTYGGAFKGTFDGAGHTISNIYQNTWQLKGNYDGSYWNAAMGIFGYVYGGTVKNLTVDNFSSDGEYTPTGVIAAYAASNATFENIAITNCNPRVYNTGNGGIIGIAGNSSGGDAIQLTNITVDNSNKISALWGSWDVACGGLVGMFRGNDKGSTISFNNCHVSAQIDVYNDVCANYQYYAYRYAGMMIGSVRNNTTNDEGKTIPNMTGISASGCTVNYGDWNDYYYCEFVENTLASYTHDYQMSRVSNEEIDTKNGKENATCIDHNHDEHGYETVNGVSVLVEDKQAVYLPFHQLFTGYSWGVTSVGLKEFGGIYIEGVSQGDQEESVEKFKTKFTGDFLYRVGNAAGSTVSLGTLFEAVDDIKYPINNSGVVVTIDKVDEKSNVSGVFTKASEGKSWAEGTIQFSGTGIVKVTIQDYNFCTPTELYLEVVDAVNATSATSATANNVVLLNDAGFNSLEVSGGYTLYGNGFTLTCGSDSPALDMGYSFVTLNNGTLDNVQIVTPNFDYAVLYKSNMTESGNRSQTTDKTRYYNVKSGVMVSGSSQILNSRISGARAAVNVSGGNVLIDNSRIELGAVASLLVGAANSVTLRDVTLVQKPAASTYDSSKTLMGFSVLVICNADGSSATINLEGNLIQNAWVDDSDKQYVPSAGQSIIEDALKQTDYLHDLDSDGTKESLNLGIAYMPQSALGKVDTTTIKDNRTDKESVPYDYASVSSTKVYSYKNANGTNDPFKAESDYESNKQGDIITVTYSDNTDGLESSKSFGTDSWVYELNVDLDKASGYKLDFSKLSMSVNGTTVTDFNVNGSAKPTSPVAVTAGGTNYTLTATVNGKAHTAIFKVTGTETTKESPSLVASNYAAALLVGEAGSTLSKDTWHGAAPALEGIQIKYWSVAEKQYKTIKLSDYTPTTAGKQNGTNTTWTYSPTNGDFTLTLTGGQVHSSNNVSAIPVVCGGKLYFVAATSSGLVNYGNSARTIPVSYSFKDNNGGEELIFSYTWSIECVNGNTAYDYSDFMNGTSKTFTIKSSNGNVCVTGDTLVSLADGSQKRIDEVTYEDQLLVWNFFTGEYDIVPPAIIFNHGKDNYDVLKLTFSDGTSVKVLNNHGFFDVAKNAFVFIDEKNVANYVGHEFVKTNGKTTSNVTLVTYEIYHDYVGSYSIQSAMHNNFMVEGMFSITMPAYEGWFDYFEIGEGMKYDEAKMQADIEKYGLYDYSDFAEFVSYEQFIAFNGPYLKVLVGRGVVTYEQILNLIATYVNP